MHPTGPELGDYRILLRRTGEAVQEGLVFNARRLLYHSTVGSRVMMKKKKTTVSSEPMVNVKSISHMSVAFICRKVAFKAQSIYKAT